MNKKIIVTLLLLSFASVVSASKLPPKPISYSITESEQTLKDLNAMVFFINDKPEILKTLNDIEVKNKRITWGDGCSMQFKRLYIQDGPIKRKTTDLYLSYNNCDSDIYDD